MTAITNETLAAALGAAMSATRLEDVVEGVKSLIAGELAMLSPDAAVVRTDYFNHTYMPDFVLEWRDQGRTSSRPVFIRNAIRPSVARDLDNLEARDPVVLSLREPGAQEQSELAPVRARVSASPHALVTDALSLERMGTSQGQGNLASPPLLQLVRANVMRGARGYLTGIDAAALTSSASVDLDSPDARQELAAFGESAGEHFAEDAALRLRRAAELLSVGTAGPEDAQSSLVSTGRLSSSELRVLLPYLLSKPAIAGNRELWLRLGRMVDIDALVDSRHVLADLDLSPLVRPNLPLWKAKRAQLAINADAFGAEASAEDASATDGWRLRGKALCGQVGPWRLYLATDARHLKGREATAGRVPGWSDVRDALGGFVIDAVSLRGLARRVEISAEESGDVARDVQRVSDTLEDSYSIPYVAVRTVGAEWHVDVDFADMTATASRGGGDALTLARAGLQLLGHRQPVDLTVLVNSEDLPITTDEAPELDS